MDFSPYFTQLSVGILGLTPLVPWRAVGKGYYLVNLAVGLAFLPVAWFFRTSTGGAAGGPADLLFGAYGILAALSILTFWTGSGQVGARLALAAALVGAAAVAADGVRVAGLLRAGAAPSPAVAAPLLAFNFLAGALLLGSVISAMLLGHWYLVVKDLPVRPLQVLTWTFFGALGARIVATLAAWALDPAGAARLADRSFLFVLVYGLFSLGTPLAMSWMVWGTVKIRSTQAATGILYGVTAFVLMGEASGRFLLVRTGFPL